MYLLKIIYIFLLYLLYKKNGKNTIDQLHKKFAFSCEISQSYRYFCSLFVKMTAFVEKSRQVDEKTSPLPMGKYDR